LISIQSVLNWTRSAGFARGQDAFVAQRRRIIRVLQGGRLAESVAKSIRGEKSIGNEITVRPR